MEGYRPNAGEEAKLSSELCQVIPMVENLGGLSGSALYGTHGIYRKHDQSALVNAEIDPTNPVTTARDYCQLPIASLSAHSPLKPIVTGSAQSAPLLLESYRPHGTSESPSDQNGSRPSRGTQSPSIIRLCNKIEA